MQRTASNIHSGGICFGVASWSPAIKDNPSEVELVGVFNAREARERIYRQPAFQVLVSAVDVLANDHLKIKFRSTASRQECMDFVNGLKPGRNS